MQWTKKYRLRKTRTLNSVLKEGVAEGLELWVSVSHSFVLCLLTSAEGGSIDSISPLVKVEGRRAYVK